MDQDRELVRACAGDLFTACANAGKGTSALVHAAPYRASLFPRAARGPPDRAPVTPRPRRHGSTSDATSYPNIHRRGRPFPLTSVRGVAFGFLVKETHMSAETTTNSSADVGENRHVGTDLIGVSFEIPGLGGPGSGAVPRVMRVVRTDPDYPQEVIVADVDDNEFRAVINHVRALIGQAQVSAQSPAGATEIPTANVSTSDSENVGAIDLDTGGKIAGESTSSKAVGMEAPPPEGDTPPRPEEVAVATTPAQRLAHSRATYVRLKDERPDAVIVFADGEAYECYDADAQFVAETLGRAIVAVKYPEGYGYGFRATITHQDIDAITAGGRLVTVVRVAVAEAADGSTSDATAATDQDRETAAFTPSLHDDVLAPEVEPQARAAEPAADVPTIVSDLGATATGQDAQPVDADQEANTDDASAPDTSSQGSAQPAQAEADTTPASDIARERLLVSLWVDAGVGADGTISVDPKVRISVGPHKKNGDAMSGDVLMGVAMLDPVAVIGDLSTLGGLVAGFIGTRQTRKEEIATQAKIEKTQQTQRRKDQKNGAQTQKNADKATGLKAAARRAATPIIAPVLDASVTPLAPLAPAAAPAPLIPAIRTGASAQAAAAALAKRHEDEGKVPPKRQDVAPAGQLDLLSLIGE